MQFIVPHKMTLFEALTGFMAPDSSKSTIRAWLKYGRVQVDGAVVKLATSPLSPNQTVVVSAREIESPKGLKILYEDPYIVVIDKNPGLLSVATAFEETMTAHALLKKKYRPGRVHVVHRLDQETSGVMLFARTEEACLNLKRTFEIHDIERRYVAIVEGRLEEKTGMWSSYLVEDARYMVHETLDRRKGELAVTHYEVFSETAEYSWLNVKLETGKKNQIRVHCKSANIPVVGDEKYGSTKNPLKRLGLHAASIEFPHPITGKKMRFESSPPASFERLMRS